VSIPKSLESLGVAASVLNGMVLQLVAAATIEERRRVAAQMDAQITVLLEELDAYRAMAVRRTRTLPSDAGVTAP
jgi:hypothetical protein